MQELYRPTYTLSEISEKTGVPSATIRQWIHKKVWTIGVGVQQAEKYGLANKFSGATAIGFALTKLLTDAGVKPRLAAQAASKFVHTGDENRDPCKLFGDGSTFIAVNDTNQAVVNLHTDLKATQFLGRIYRPNTFHQAITILELDDHIMLLFRSFGFHPQQALTEKNEAGGN